MESKEKKNKNSPSVYHYQEPHWPKHETLTHGKHKVPTNLVWSSRKNNRPEE